MHTHKLIRLIRARPMLYNFELEDYNNKLIAERKWSEIAIEMNASVSECKTKWNSLRTAFNTYLNKLKRMKKPRTKWIHADEMAFLKQYLKRNRYSTSSSSPSNENNHNHNHHHMNDMITSNNTDNNSFLMTLTSAAAAAAAVSMKNNDEHNIDLSNYDHSNPIDYCYDSNNDEQQELSVSSSSSAVSSHQSSPTHHHHSSIINLSMQQQQPQPQSSTIGKRPRSAGSSSSLSSSYEILQQHQIMNCKSSNGDGDTKIFDHVVDVETCDDNDAIIDDDINEYQPVTKKFKSMTNKQQELSDKINENKMSKTSTSSSATATNGEKIKRITIEAPESMLICFDVHHNNTHNINNSSKWTSSSKTASNFNDFNGSEMNIFADYVAMKLRSFSLANRLETMTKIWHLLSEVTLRQFSSHDVVKTPPPSSLNCLKPLVAAAAAAAAAASSRVPPPPPPPPGSTVIPNLSNLNPQNLHLNNNL